MVSYDDYANAQACPISISIGHRACVSCDDTDYEFIQYQYQMYFLVEDAEGSQLKISVSDDVCASVDLLCTLVS